MKIQELLNEIKFNKALTSIKCIHVESVSFDASSFRRYVTSPKALIESQAATLKAELVAHGYDLKHFSTTNRGTRAVYYAEKI